MMENESASLLEDLNQFTALQSGIDTDMDPRLQLAALKIRQGIQKPISASTEANHIAVIAKVTNLEAWETLTEVTPGAVIKSSNSEDFLVTARIPVARINFLRKLPFVKSMKAAQRVQSELSATVRETGAHPDLLPPDNQTNGGKGIVVGIIDFGCDFVHRNFRNDDGSTRFLSIWDQTAPAEPDSPFGYGKVYDKNQINAALNTTDPYAALGYAPEIDPRGTHGTHVTDIASGNGNGSNVAGVAPEADLIFVELSASDIPWTGSDVVKASFGDSVQLVEAVRYIFDQAGNRPCVINLSLGTNGGPHDGSTLAEQSFDSIVQQQPNRAIVIAASNSYADGIHAAGNLADENPFELKWNIASSDFTHNEIEIWFDGDDRFSVELIDPLGNVLLQVDPEDTKFIKVEGKIVVLVSNRLNDRNNGDNVIAIFLEEGLPPDTWGTRLTGLTIEKGEFHAWIERDDANPSSFVPPHDNSHTIGSISCGNKTLVVGSYDAHKSNLPLSYFSSAGPTRDGRYKPEISAPGHDVWAAKSRTGNKVVKKSGTSMASPAVTGIIALIFAEAAAQGKSLTIDELREILIDTAREDPPPAGGWDGRYGFGRISAAEAVSKV